MKIPLTLLSLATATAVYACGGYDTIPVAPIVHEWGTFTSVQGGDGLMIRWHAQQIGDLPRFVHNWLQPDLGRQTKTELFLGKAGLSGLQRMETPVIYFYSDVPFKADVEVRFPKGLITEWYPQASQIGPCTLRTNASQELAKYGAKESVAKWENLQITPAGNMMDIAKLLPQDDQGSHYFAARKTDAAIVRSEVDPKTPQHEKFLFYRGTGSFGTPLSVTTRDDGLVTLQNKGNTPLAGLFLLHVKNGKAEWSSLDKIDAKALQPWQRFNSGNSSKPVATVQKEIGTAMAKALVAAGLYPAEAEAMVATWNDAWFGEEGVRVLYLLPRAWTDEILPLKLNPKPRQLVRVMVGRAEIIPPQLTREMAVQLKLANDGNAKAKETLQVYYQKMGRFYGPALQLAQQLLERDRNNPIATASVF
jgi:hypothetical protein